MGRARFDAIGLAVLTMTAFGWADVITPVGVRGTSEFGAVDIFGDGNLSDVFVSDLIDGGGLIDIENTPDNVLDDLHDNDALSTNGWHAGDFAAGLPGGTDGDDEWLTPPAVDQQVLEFDLGGLFDISKTHIWQQNQGPFFDAPSAPDRGVDQFQILASTESSGDNFRLIGTFNLEAETGFDPVPAQVLSLGPDPVRAQRIRFHLESAHSGEVFEFVGLSEVRFEGTSATLPGDYDADGLLTAHDIDLLSTAIRTGDTSPPFDLNHDARVDSGDRDTWVEQLRQTWYGDANLDGEFSTQDLVDVLAAGQYEDDQALNSTWASGDWDGDADFNSSDLVIALAGGGFEQGPRQAAAAVPEPSGLMLAARRNAVPSAPPARNGDGSSRARPRRFSAAVAAAVRWSPCCGWSSATAARPLVAESPRWDRPGHARRSTTGQPPAGPRS